MGPTPARAQTTETVEVSRAKKKIKKAGRTRNGSLRHHLPTSGTRVWPRFPHPSIRLIQLGDHLSSVRWELAAVGGGLVAIGMRDWDWGGSNFSSSRRFVAQNTRHGGMDKIGHAFSTYVIADILTDRIRANRPIPQAPRSPGRSSPSESWGWARPWTGSRASIASRARTLSRTASARPFPSCGIRCRFAGEAGLAADVHAGELRAAGHHGLGGFRHHPALSTPALHHGLEGQRVESSRTRLCAMPNCTPDSMRAALNGRAQTQLPDRTDLLCRRRIEPQRDPFRSTLRPELREASGHAPCPGRPEEPGMHSGALHGGLLR